MRHDSCLLRAAIQISEELMQEKNSQRLRNPPNVVSILWNVFLPLCGEDQAMPYHEPNS